jgi:hypothetical protein
MSDNGHDGEKQFPYPLVTKGKGYDRALKSRSKAILNSLTGMLASNYKSSIPSTNYAQYLNTVALELGKLTLALEALSSDISFEDVRSEFLHQIIGYLIFSEDDFPDLSFDDEGYRQFLLKIIELFFQGSTPKTIADAVSILTKENFKIFEVFLAGGDISEQFGFTIEIEKDANIFPVDPFVFQYNLQLLIHILKPAHTLYVVSHRFNDIYKGVEKDESSWRMADYRYEEVRGYWKGLKGWTSDTGYIQWGALDTFYDDNRMFGRVREGALLTIKDGTNSGVYRVRHTTEDYVVVSPKFKAPEQNIEYILEVDYLGRKEEKQGFDDGSCQFVSPYHLEVQILGTYTTFSQTNFPVTAVTNTSQEVTFLWDLTGNGVYDDAEGQKVFFPAGLIAGTYPISVLAISKDGREAKAFSEVIVYNVRREAQADLSGEGILDSEYDIEIILETNFEGEGEVLFDSETSVPLEVDFSGEGEMVIGEDETEVELGVDFSGEGELVFEDLDLEEELDTDLEVEVDFSGEGEVIFEEWESEEVIFVDTESHFTSQAFIDHDPFIVPDTGALVNFGEDYKEYDPETDVEEGDPNPRICIEDATVEWQGQTYTIKAGTCEPTQGGDYFFRGENSREDFAGEDDTDPNPSKAEDPLTNQVMLISAGTDHRMVVYKDGRLETWTLYKSDPPDYFGKLGRAGIFHTPLKVPFFDDNEVTAISAGDRHSMALDKDGKLYTWGFGGEGEVDDFLITPYDESDCPSTELEAEVDFLGEGELIFVEWELEEAVSEVEVDFLGEGELTFVEWELEEAVSEEEAFFLATEEDDYFAEEDGDEDYLITEGDDSELEDPDPPSEPD